MQRVESHESFGGTQEVWSHASANLDCDMRFGVYLPPQARQQKCPVLYWLSGLTCTEQNFITKAGVQSWAAQHGLIVVAPDTSPRGEGIADDPAYDLGQGAGFYINATRDPWAKHYRMFDYVTDELPRLIESHFPANALRGISGHSMGGHGALVCALKKPDLYKSVSAFAPIASPTRTDWGQKIFSHYLGEENKASWADWDSSALLAVSAQKRKILVDQGADDEFLSRLNPDFLKEAAQSGGHDLELRMRAGYDHSYYFVASFIGEHVAFHAAELAK